MKLTPKQIGEQMDRLSALNGLLAYTYTIALMEFKRRFPAGPRPMLDTTHRNQTEQARLYAQGRTTPGEIVTWAKPGESKHNRLPAQAFDIKFMYQDGSVDWDEDWFSEFWECVKLAGTPVSWGGMWSKDKIDRPHFEM